MTKVIFPYKTEDFSIPSSDGTSQLFVRHFSRGVPRLHFLIVHGALEHSGRHQDLVEYWLRNFNEVAITVYDLVGHGRSGGARAFVPQFKVYVDDFLRIGEFIQSKIAKTTKQFICAHSLGGLISLSTILDPIYGWPYPLNGIILSSPCIKPIMALGSFSEPILERLDKLTPKLHLPMIYHGSDLTTDKQRANDFDTDSLIPKYISVRMAKVIIEGSYRIRGLSYYLRVPNLFLISGDDQIVEEESTVLFAHGIDKSISQHKIYPECKHELWNEENRLEIFDTMKKWVERNLKEKV